MIKTMNKDFIEDRVIQEANYIIMTQCTVRECAKKFQVSKSTVHRDMRVVLPKINIAKYDKVDKVLNKNLEERHFRGGMATKIKYNKENDKYTDNFKRDMLENII